MRKTYNDVIIIYYFQIVLRNSLHLKTPESGSGLRFLAGSGFNEYGSETLENLGHYTTTTLQGTGHLKSPADFGNILGTENQPKKDPKKNTKVRRELMKNPFCRKNTHSYIFFI